MTTDKIYDDAGVIRAEYYNWKPRLGAKRLQLIMEVPLEHQEKVLKILGAPSPDSAKWVVIGLLKDLTEGATDERSANVVPLKDPVRAAAARESYREASDAARAVKDAGMMCKDPAFWRWASRYGAHVYDQGSAKRFMYIHLGIKSRREIGVNPEILEAFAQSMRVPFLESTPGRMAERH